MSDAAPLPVGELATATRTGQLPLALRDVEEAIREAQGILAMREDPEGDGSPGYAASTLQRATDFLREATERAWSRYRVHVQAPRLTPGLDGSIDVHWRTERRELLVTVPAEATDPVPYYGNDRIYPDDPIRQTIEGRLDLAAPNEWLIVWVAQ